MRRMALAIAVATTAIFVLWMRESPRATFERYAGWSLPADAEDIRVTIAICPEGNYVFSRFKPGAKGFEAFRESVGGVGNVPYVERVEFARFLVAPDWWTSNVDAEGITLWVAPSAFGQWDWNLFMYDAQRSLVYVAVPLYDDPDRPWSRLRPDRWLAEVRRLIGL